MAVLRPNESLDLPRHGAVRALPLIVNGVSCGSVLRGRGGDRHSQRHSKVKGDDPAPRGNRARWYVGDPFRGYMLLGPPSRRPPEDDNSPLSVE